MFIRFLPNMVLKSALMCSLSVPNFRTIGAHIDALWQILQNVPNEEEK